MSSTLASSAIVEPAATAKLVGLRVHLIPPGTVESDEATIADKGAVWPNSRKMRPIFAVLESGSQVPCTGPCHAELDPVLVEADVVERQHLDAAGRAGGEDRDAVVGCQLPRSRQPCPSRRDEPRCRAGRQRVHAVRRRHHAQPVEPRVRDQRLQRLEGLRLLVLAGHALHAQAGIDAEALAVVEREGEPRERRDARAAAGSR